MGAITAAQADAHALTKHAATTVSTTIERESGEEKQQKQEELMHPCTCM